jgi:hypothetical protein|nr:MAG TPA: hypothetical protein [Caudoviricetes sp.]
MQRVIKTIPAERGKLYALINGDRYLLAECHANIEIIEDAEEIPVLGRGRVITDRSVTILVTFAHKPRFGVNLASLSGFGFQGEVLRQDGVYERMVFDHCLLASDLDLTEAGECTFEIRCSAEQLKRIRNI